MSQTFMAGGARHGGVEVAGWAVDQKTRVRFQAYPHGVWALWWQGDDVPVPLSG